MATGALARAVGRAAARRDDAVERCGMCSEPVPPEHRHLLDERDSSILCSCRPCTLLFSREAASSGHFRLVPADRARLSGLDVEVLNVPVGLAFFVREDDGRVLAHYPSPLGTTESVVAPEAWAAVAAQAPELAALRPRVEALLVRSNAVRERDEHWVVPIDDCYRLVAAIRRSWSGMSGGSAVWREIAGFFADLGRRTPRRGVGSPG